MCFQHIVVIETLMCSVSFITCLEETSAFAAKENANKQLEKKGTKWQIHFIALYKQGTNLNLKKQSENDALKGVLCQAVIIMSQMVLSHL